MCSYFLTSHMDLLSSEMLIFSLYLIVALEHSQFLEVGPAWFFMFRAQKPASCALQMDGDMGRVRGWGKGSGRGDAIILAPALSYK